MADEFQLGSGNWWDSTRTNTRYDDDGTTTPAAATSSTPLSSMGSNNYGWQTDIMDIKTRRSSMEPATVSVSGGSNSMAFTDLQKLQESSRGPAAAAAAGGLLPDPSLQMMGLGLSSHNMDWNQTLFRGAGKAEGGSFSTMLQEEATNTTNYQQQQDDQWRQKLFGESPDDHDDYKQIGRAGGLSLDQPHEYSSHGSSNNSPNLNNNFQVDSSSDYHTNHMLQAGFLLSENHHHQQQQQQQQQQSFDCQSPMTNYGLYPSNYASSMHNNQLNTTSWSKFPQFLRASPPPKQPPPLPPPPQGGQLQFSNNAPFWNASSTTTVNDSSRSGLFPPIQSTQLPPPNFQEKSKNTSEVRDSAGTSKKNNSSDASSKRARQETAPTMPAFKVRKEKMGDRITALQQLVSPFGKTDTASVLSEAIEYIKFLHEQVSVLSTPYMKNGTPLHHQHQQDPEGLIRQDLRSRGLCLVPVSSTFPVTHESTVDYWTPTFGGTFR